MRRDVHKVISERPKGGRTWESKAPRTKHPLLDAAGEDLRDLPGHLRQKRQKHRSPRINVLERFLLNRAGRPWNQVFAEACQAADPRSFGGAEVRDYVKDLVAIECWLDGRIVMSHDWRGCPRPVRGLYVHPKTGLLARNDRKPTRSFGDTWRS